VEFETKPLDAEDKEGRLVSIEPGDMVAGRAFGSRKTGIILKGGSDKDAR
jgi:hypothetical protein